MHQRNNARAWACGHVGCPRVYGQVTLRPDDRRKGKKVKVVSGCTSNIGAPSAMLEQQRHAVLKRNEDNQLFPLPGTLYCCSLVLEITSLFSAASTFSCFFALFVYTVSESHRHGAAAPLMRVISLVSLIPRRSVNPLGGSSSGRARARSHGHFVRQSPKNWACY